MKKQHFVFIWCFLISIVFYGQEKGFSASADDLAITVVSLRIDKKGKDGVDSASGTGSFMEKDGKLYIITASHVAKFMNKDSYIIIQGQNNKSVKLNLIALAFPVNWKYHKEADSAILQLNPSKDTSNEYLHGRFIPYAAIDTAEVSIPRNNQLTIIGFPLGLGDKGYFSPLTYRTFPSSGLITFNRADTKTLQTFIVLENPSVGGYSGGPVYDLGIIANAAVEMHTGNTRLHGFIHGTLPDDTGGKMTTMTPAFYLKDFFK